MKRIVQTLLLLFVVIAGFLVVYETRLKPSYPDSYLQAMASKREKMDRTSSPKIVLVGDENINHGIDGHQMEIALGMPVVNMGMTAKIGIEGLLDYIKWDVKDGDIVILSLSYEHFIELGDMEMETRKRNYQSEHYAPIMFRQDNLKEEVLEGSFDGDIKKQPITTEAAQNHIKKLTKVNNHFSKENIRLFITPPMTIEGQYEVGPWQKFWKNLSDKTGIPILGHPSSGFYPKEFFRDKYTANPKGRMKRTDDLIKVIREKNLVANEVVRLVPKNAPKGKLDLKEFDNSSGITITKRDTGLLAFRVNATSNYLRIQRNGIDYSGHSFSIRVKCPKELKDDIYFMGTKKERFDKVVDLGDGAYRFFKRNLTDPLFRNGASYIGLTIGSGKKRSDAVIAITDAKVYMDTGPNTLPGKTAGTYRLRKNSNLSFVVTTPNRRFLLQEIFSSPIAEDVSLRSNEIYSLATSGNTVYLRHFDTDINIVELELDSEAALRAHTNGSVVVFKRELETEVSNTYLK